MIDSIDLLSLETRCRDLIGEDTASLWTSAQVRRAINDEKSRLVRKVIDLDAGYFETSATFTPATTITLPINCYTVRNVEVYGGSVWYPVRWIGAHNKEQYQDLSGSAFYQQPLAVRFAENSIIFEGGITGVSSVKVQYARAPADMQSYAATAGAATTVTFDSASVHDDVYNGDLVLVSSGTGVGQVRTVTDYVASTYTLTVATWGTNPDTTSVITWCLPDPLYKWPDVVALGAAIRLVGRRRDAESHSVLMQQYVNDVGEMMSSLVQRQTDQPRHINYMPDGDE